MKPCLLALILHSACLIAETLYNGVVLPAAWPPRVTVSHEPQDTPPYLVAPPEVIPIDVGRQLFVDQFLIQDTTLRRTFHRPQYWSGNPVLRPDKLWEQHKGVASAMPFSDGVWWDPKDRIYKMWYRTSGATLYAFSKDGIHWEKPDLDVKPGTNIVHVAVRDSGTVWLDQEEKDPARRYKLFYVHGHLKPMSYFASADGIHWGQELAQTGPVGDRSTMFWNPFRKVWVWSLRDHTAGIIKDGRRQPGENVRFRAYREHADLVTGMKWRPDEGVPWTGADRLDPMRIELNHRPELYNLDAVAYESVMLGLFSIWYGQPPDRPKPNEIYVGFSRDGFHWDRPDRHPFIGVSENGGDWNWGNVQSAGGGCLIVGDRLWFYVSGRTGPRSAEVDTTGLATLRRDGFVSMDAGSEEGVLTTRPVRFAGRHLFVNVNSAAGELRVEILNKDFQPIAPFTLSNSIGVHVDNTLQPIKWRGRADLSSLAAQPVRFRFHLRHGQLYSFWVSPDAKGASRGYVAAGGPGFTGPLDTMGSEIYSHCCATDIHH
jgi:hypothetical protein